jgi:hypothetical protein
MADPQSHGDHPDDDNLAEFFGFGDHYADHPLNSNDISNPEPPPSSGAGFSDPMTVWEAYNGQEPHFNILPAYRWLFGPLATYRFFPHLKIVFATTRLDYLKSRYICSLLLEDIINLVVSRSDYIMVL